VETEFGAKNQSVSVLRPVGLADHHWSQIKLSLKSVEVSCCAESEYNQVPAAEPSRTPQPKLKQHRLQIELRLSVSREETVSGEIRDAQDM
jgi:hypothetical protein